MEDEALKPTFVDNRDGNTLARAVSKAASALREAGVQTDELAIASAFFSLTGFGLVAGVVEDAPRVRLLLGSDPTPDRLQVPRAPGDTDEARRAGREADRAALQTDLAMRRERDLLPFTPASKTATIRLLAVLRDGHMQVRRYRANFLHAKAFVFRAAGGGLLCGSSNLTSGGLRANLELNLGHYEQPLLDRVGQWFDELWEEAEPFDLAALYEEPLAEYSPYLIYVRMLWQLYRTDLHDDEALAGELPLTGFQRHGVWRALRILERHGGVLIADGVGLGKTFTAGEIARQYRERRQRVLLVCPAALVSEWERFWHGADLLVDCVSYERLASDQRLGGDRPAALKLDPDEYALVVVDEAHNYRNPDTRTRSRVLATLMSGRARDLVLLTATPVNNSLWDLYQLLWFFMKQDAALVDKGILSIKGLFEKAMKIEPDSLNPDLLFPVIDATTVKRTRKFVKRHYAGDTIRGPDGTIRPIRFPTPVAQSIRYDFDRVAPGLFAELEEALMPAAGSPKLTMARYLPEMHLKSGLFNITKATFVGLLRAGLLKRFESSAHAFACTLGRMITEHETFLRVLAGGKVLTKELVKDISAADDETDFAEQIAEEAADAEDFDVVALKADVENDVALLSYLRDRADAVLPSSDPKLAGLVERLAEIAETARAEAIDERDERDKRKVIVFSAFADTIDWVETFLATAIENDPRLACYRGRMVSVSGQDSRGGVLRDHAIHGFAPVSTNAPDGLRGDRYDLLLSTDVLAEGLNLHQCRHIINYDLPWNPMRLVQRHGRVDRINSDHREVFLHTFFPDRELDRLLRLEQRVRRKLAQAARSVGVETAPIEKGDIGEQSFSETRAEIEKLEQQDATIFEEGGTRSAAQSGEEYRQELRAALESMGEEIEGLAWHAGSGLRSGERRGHVFCAVVGEATYLRFVPIGGDSDEVVREVATCLRLVECDPDTERVMPADLADGVYAAWERAREDIHAEWMRATDPKNLQPKVAPLNHAVAEHIRNYPPLGASQDEVRNALDAIESPWPARDERILRLAFNDPDAAGSEKSARLLQVVKDVGAQPFIPPEPLPVIDKDDIHLVVWMAIDNEGDCARSTQPAPITSGSPRHPD